MSDIDRLEWFKAQFHEYVHPLNLEEGAPQEWRDFLDKNDLNLIKRVIKQLGDWNAERKFDGKRITYYNLSDVKKLYWKYWHENKDEEKTVHRGGICAFCDGFGLVNAICRYNSRSGRFVEVVAGSLNNDGEFIPDSRIFCAEELKLAFVPCTCRIGDKYNYEEKLGWSENARKIAVRQRIGYNEGTGGLALRRFLETAEEMICTTDGCTMGGGENKRITTENTEKHREF